MPMNQLLLRPKRGGMAYYIKDDFTDTLAAGSVHGTASTPGPGTRHLVDTEDKVSIAGAGFVLNGGRVAPDYDDPWAGITIPIVRASGQVVYMPFNFTSGYSRFGLFDALGGKVGAEGFKNINGRVLLESGGDRSEYLNISMATEYEYAVALRSPSGAYHFIKGGAFTHWELIYHHLLNAADPLYAAIASYNIVGTVNKIRVPKTLWLPSLLAYDTFTRSNGAIGSTEAAGPEAQGATVNAWTGATWTIDTNKVKNTPTLGSTLDSGTLTIGSWYQVVASEVDHFYTGSAADDCFLATAETGLDANNTVKEITLSTMLATFDAGVISTFASVDLVLDTGVQAAGLISNLDSAVTPANFLVTIHNRTNATVYKCVAGTYSAIITAAGAYSDSRLLKLQTRRIAANLQVRLFYNDVGIGNETLVGNAGIVDNTIHGIMSTNPVNRLNDYQLMARGEEGQYDTFLDKV